MPPGSPHPNRTCGSRIRLVQELALGGREACSAEVDQADKAEVCKPLVGQLVAHGLGGPAGCFEPQSFPYPLVETAEPIGYVALGVVVAPSSKDGAEIFCHLS